MSGAERTVVGGLEELAGLVGKQLGTGSWRTISEADIDGFAAVTGDHQWIHVDCERAASRPFGAPIAHGFLTLSLCAAVLEETLQLSGTSMQVNYGLNRVRFPSPVPAGAEVRGLTELSAVEPIEGGAQAIVSIVVEARDAPKPACVADAVIRFYT